MARVVVVGAGAGGLAVAARLAAKRHDVTILERSDHVGGKLRTYSRDGFSFDLGPSLLTLPAVYRDLFLKTGHPLEHEVELVETEPGFTYTFADGTHLRLPGASTGRTTAAISEQLGPDAGAAWQELMLRAAEIWRLTRSDVLGRPMEGLGQLARLGRQRGAVRTVAPWRSLHSMGRALPDARLRTLLDRYATYSGSNPRRAPGALITIPFVEQTFGMWHLRGGLGTLAEALGRRCQRAGATLRTGCEVTGIETDASGVTGVRVDGQHVDADIVVTDVDAARLPDLLHPRPFPRPRGRRSYSGMSILVAVEGSSAELTHHNVWFPRDYDDEFRSLARGRLPHDPAIYVCRPDDATMAPPGCEAWFVLVNAPRHGDGSADTFDWTDRQVAESYADRILALLAQRGTDIRQRVRWREVRTPKDLGRADGTGDGAIYGTAQEGPWSVLRRPRNLSPVPRLYVLGGTAHPGGGLPLVGMAAEFVADRIGRAR